MKVPIEKIKSFYSPIEQKSLSSIVREDLQLKILDYLSTSKYANDISFIGDTSIRLIWGIDRFSEDLDFDIKQIGREEFKKMTGSVASYLKNSGFNVELDYVKEDKLKAFRCNLRFPGFAYENKLSPHKDKGFLLKIECQDQGVEYQQTPQIIKRNGYFFNIQAPPVNVLCSMKLSALLQRKKGRDFYDAMFLMSMTPPDIHFLKARQGIKSWEELKEALMRLAEETNLSVKSKDFVHLEITPNSHKKILLFKNYIEQIDNLNKKSDKSL